jgi:hypothetical protein
MNRDQIYAAFEDIMKYAEWQIESSAGEIDVICAGLGLEQLSILKDVYFAVSTLLDD